MVSKITQSLQDLRAAGLRNLVDVQVLDALRDRAEVPSVISRELDLDPVTVTECIKRLEARGLAYRELNTRDLDRRKRYYGATARGKKVLWDNDLTP